MALCFTALVTPYEVAILTTKINARFAINCFVDLLYLTDMVRSFFLAYEHPKTHVLIKDQRSIAWHYLHGWFIIGKLT